MSNDERKVEKSKEGVKEALKNNVKLVVEG